MATEIQGIDLIFEVRVSSDSDTTWDRLVCALDDQAEMDNEVSEVDTKCGTFTGVKDMKGSYSGNAVANASPSAGTEVTYEEVVSWQQAKTLLDFRYYNLAFGVITQGGAVYQEGTGRFTNTVLTGATGEVVQFSWTFSPTGTIYLTAQS
jgi:hypothetical protein